MLIGIFTLSSALCRAESVSHNFNEMYAAGTLTFPNRPDYSIGVADGITYTGSTGGTFANVGGGIIGISLPNNGVIQTSPAITDLTRVTFYHNKGSAPTGVKVYISTDNSNWTEISSSATYGSSSIDAPMPTKGNYYIKLVNKSGATVNFLRVSYTYESCRCLRVVIN